MRSFSYLNEGVKPQFLGLKKAFFHKKDLQILTKISIRAIFVRSENAIDNRYSFRASSKNLSDDDERAWKQNVTNMRKNRPTFIVFTRSTSIFSSYAPSQFVVGFVSPHVEEELFARPNPVSGKDRSLNSCLSVSTDVP